MIPDEDKTKEQLINELVGLRQRVAELKSSETERKQAEEILQESERKYRSLFESMLNSFAYCKILVDENNQPIDYIHLEVNDAWERSVGLKKEDVIGKKITEVIPGIRESETDLISIYGKVALTGEETEFELYFEPLGKWFTISVYSPQRGYFVAVFEDTTERKRVEDEIRSLAKFPSENPNPVLRVAKDGTILYANKMTSPLLDVWECQVGQLLPDYLCQSILDVLGSGLHKYIEVECGEQTFSFIFAPVVDADYVNLYGRDITERKQAEEALKRSGEFFKTVFNSTYDVISIIDVHDFTIVRVNDAFMQRYGLKEEQVIGKTCYEVTHHRSAPYTPPDDTCPLRDTVTTGEHSVAEHVHYTKDGEKVYVEVSTSPIKDENGRVIQVIHVTRDITERKQAEEALRESKELFEKIFTSQRDALFILDAKRPPRIIDCNPRASEIFGYTREEILGRTTAFLHEDEAALRQFQEYLYPAIEEAGFLDLPEFRMKRKDGTVFTTAHSVVPLKDQQGKRIGWVSVVRNITERKLAEERERRLQEELNRSSRLASIGELAAGVAHEINNPLTGILGFSQRLLRKSTDEKVSQDLEVIHNEALRAAKVVANLLTFARRREPTKEYSNINDIVQKALELRAYELKTSNIEVVTDLAPSLPKTIADFQQIQEVFLNIILNAEQAMSEANRGGKLTIKTQEIKDYIRISFTDDGLGIAKEHLDKVFDPFFTTREVGGGTGLGLSICHGIVVEHGGRIYAKSKTGKGTTFFVELPIISETADKNKIVEA